MLLYFNKNGQLLEYLEYDSAARVGTTHFKIFAYFEGADDYSTYGAATIRLKRPDLQGSEYPDLFMVKKSLIFDSSIEESQYFIDGDQYNGFEFDFGSMVNDDIEDSYNRIIRLLDMPGMWEASITLQSISKVNVTGLIKFNVEYAVSEVDDDDDLNTAEIIISNVRDALLNDYVPYVGATRSLSLGSRMLEARQIRVTNSSAGESNMRFNNNNFIISCSDSNMILNPYDGKLYYGEPSPENEVATKGSGGTAGPIPAWAIIINTLTNINGWVLSNFESNLITVAGTYQAYQITRSGNTLTEEQARNYMEDMCGSRFLPTYDFNKPLNSYFITYTGELLKPQYDPENGLLLFKMIQLPLGN